MISKYHTITFPLVVGIKRYQKDQSCEFSYVFLPVIVKNCDLKNTRGKIEVISTVIQPYDKGRLDKIKLIVQSIKYIEHQNYSGNHLYTQFSNYLSLIIEYLKKTLTISLEKDQAEIILALLFHDRDELSTSVTSSFRVVGLSYFLTSGGLVFFSFLLGSEYFLSRFVSQKIAYVTAFFIGGFYLVVTNATPLLLKMLLMYGARRLAWICNQRPFLGVYWLIILMGGFLAWNPWLIYSTGFQASCFISLLFLVMSKLTQKPRWKARNWQKLTHLTREAFLAELYLTPIFLLFDSEVSMLHFIGSFLLCPYLFIIFILGLVHFVVAAAAPQFVELSAWPLRVSIDSLMMGVHWLAQIATRLPMLKLEIGWPSVFGWWLSLYAIMRLWQSKHRQKQAKQYAI